jgi:hypothetical protein
MLGSLPQQVERPLSLTTTILTGQIRPVLRIKESHADRI